MCTLTKECSETIKRSSCDRSQLYLTVNNLKKNGLFLSLFWVFCTASLSFHTTRRKRRKKSFIPLKWKKTLSQLTGKSVSCWRWKDCGLFNRENRTISPSLHPGFSVLYSHTTAHIFWMGGALCGFTVKKIKSWVLLFIAFKHIVPAASGHRQWLGLIPCCVCSRVWPCWRTPLNRSHASISKETAKWQGVM